MTCPSAYRIRSVRVMNEDAALRKSQRMRVKRVVGSQGHYSRKLRLSFLRPLKKTEWSADEIEMGIRELGKERGKLRHTTSREASTNNNG